MKNKLRRIFTAILAVVVTVVSLGVTEVKAASPKKLGRSDFVYTAAGEKVNFIKVSKKYDDGYRYVYAALTNEGKECKGAIKDFTTKRKVKEGSTLSFVKKKYGEQKLKKMKSTMKIYKSIKYEQPQLDISTWENYLSYSYKEGKDTYKLLFCFDKKNKVKGIIYIRNENKFKDYPNKEINMGIQFKAPKGKKVKTENIGGKTVYLLPKGTTVSYDKKYDKQNSFSVWCWYEQYDIYGNIKAKSEGDYDYLPSGKMENCVKDCYLWDAKKDTPKYNKKGELQYLDNKKLGKCRYFVLNIYVTLSSDGEDGEELAPQIVYFKFV